MNFRLFILLLCIGSLAWLGCTPRGADHDEHDARPRVVATTTIVGDFVRRIGGDEIQLHVLIPPHADPHDYIFRPADMVMAAKADLAFINGAGLEGHLDRLLQGVTTAERIVSLTDRVPMRHMEDGHDHDHTHACDDADMDPHVWTDPNHMMIWARAIAEALTALAPHHEDVFAGRADALIDELRALDAWIKAQVAQIPPARRLLVTDHYSMGYFADRYGFEEAGVLIRSLDSAARPSARDLVRLMDDLKTRGISAIFVSRTVNPQLAEQMARDAGVALVPLYSGALSEAHEPAGDYMAYMRYNVEAMVKHLR